LAVERIVDKWEKDGVLLGDGDVGKFEGGFEVD
jgi:hypothetical protein